MNKILVSLHWCFHIIACCLLYYMQQNMSQYDPNRFMYIAISSFSIALILFTFMMIKNNKAYFYHLCIMLLGIIFTYKILQISLITAWLSYCIAILYAIQLKALSHKFYKGWGLWGYTLIIWLILPLYNLIHYFINKPVITSVFDNDFLIINGMNPVFTGTGYIVLTFNKTQNYLGNGPIIVFILLTAILSLPLCLQYTRSRKDKSHETIKA